MTELILGPILRFKSDLDDVASKSLFFNLVSQVIIYCIWLFNDLPESRLGRSLDKEALQSKRAPHPSPRNGMPFELFIITRSRFN